MTRAEALVLLPALAFYGVFIARTPVSFGGRSWFWLFDDAMISMRYARNLAEGHGLVWNPGERVEGYSNFLWTLVMAVVHLFGFSDSGASLAMMLIGAVLLVATALVAGRICDVLAPGERVPRLAAIALTATFYPLVYWTLHGLEVGLAALLVALAVLLAIEPGEWSTRRCALLALTLAAAVLTRDDLLLPALIVLGWAAWRLPGGGRRRVVAIVGGTLLATVAAHTAFRLAYYDAALPNTYYLKLSGIGLGTRLARGSAVVGYTWLTELYLALLLAGALLAVRRKSLHPGAWLLALLFVAQCAYSLYVGGDAFEALQFANRYIATVAPLLLVLAALGLAELLRAAATRRAVTIAVGVGACAVALLQLPAWIPTERFEVTGGGTERLLPAVAVAAAIALVAAAAARSGSAATRRRTSAAAAIVATVALGATLNARPLRDWARPNALDATLEAQWVRTGLLVRELTPPGTSVAMTAAGNIAYFDHRPGVDLLGKTDSVVAHEPPRPVHFRPGHDKWDYAHSIGRLRPDLIVQMGQTTPADLCALAAWGYHRIAPLTYVRAGSPVAGAQRELGPRIAAITGLTQAPAAPACPRRPARPEASG